MENEKIVAVHMSGADFEKVKKLLEASNLEIKFLAEKSEMTLEDLELGLNKFM